MTNEEKKAKIIDVLTGGGMGVSTLDQSLTFTLRQLLVNIDQEKLSADVAPSLSFYELIGALMMASEVLTDEQLLKTDKELFKRTVDDTDINNSKKQPNIMKNPKDERRKMNWLSDAILDDSEQVTKQTISEYAYSASITIRHLEERLDEAQALLHQAEDKAYD